MRQWLKRLFSRRDRGKPRVENVNGAIAAIWEGTPYLDSLAFMRLMAQGKDKTEIVAASSEYFDMARAARQRGDLDAMIHTLCVAIAGFVIAADLYDAAAALGNLGMVYEKKGEFAIAARLQRHALAMKQEIGLQGEPISRSHWLIGRAEEGSRKLRYGARRDVNGLRHRSESGDPNAVGLGRAANRRQRLDRQSAAGLIDRMLRLFRALLDRIRGRQPAVGQVPHAPDPRHIAMLEGINERMTATRAAIGKYLQLDVAPTRFDPLRKNLRNARSSPALYMKKLRSLAEHFAATGRPASAARAARVAIEVGRRATPPFPVGSMVPYFLDASISAGKTKIENLDSYLAELTPGVGAWYRSRLAEAGGEIAEAFDCALRAIELLEPEGLTPSLMFAYHHLATLHASTGNAAGASRIARKAIDGAEAALRDIPLADRVHVRGFIDDTARLVILSAFQTQTASTWETIDIAERTRARSLLEQLGEEFLPQSSSLPEALRAAERGPLTLLQIAKRLTRHVSATERRLPESEEGELRTELWDVLDTFPDAHADYVRLRKGVPLPAKKAIELLRACHPRTHTFLFKTCGERMSRWWIDDEGVIRDSALLHVPADELQAEACLFTRYCATPYSDVAPRAEALRQALFGTTLDHVAEGSTIVIVPSGVLWNVPFCSLAINGRYLVDRFSFCLLPSLSVIAYWDYEEPVTATLVLGDSRGDLPSAAEEARAVGKLLRSEPLLTAQVNRIDIERRIASCRFIHVASHAISDATVPEFSGIYLADGTLLSAADMETLRLNCTLMFLSGCKTGHVELAQNDDPSTIGTGGLRAGAKAVIYSLWEINDLATRDIATRFYQEMLGGAALDAALRQAQRSILRRQRTSHPFFWGAFHLMGAMRPPAARSTRR